MDFVIDGNAYLNVAVSVSRNIAFRDKRIGSKYYVNDILNDGEYILKEQVKLEFRNFCLNYFYSLIAPVGKKIGRVHLVFDSRSWRKDYIQKFFESDTNFGDSKSAPDEFVYKGTRKKDNMIYLFFEYFQNEIAPALTKLSGVNYYRINGTEGDDIIAYLCEILNTDVMVYTVDGDIAQLTYSHDKNVIVIYPKQQRKHKKLCVPQDFNPEWAQDEEDNFFSLSESHVATPSITQTITALKEKDYVEYIIDPVTDIFTKIFRGDKKDNIPKMDNMTPTKTKKLIELIQTEYGNNSVDLLDALDETFVNFLVKNISILNKISEIDQLSDVRKHLLFNTRLIRLYSKLFPQPIQDRLKSSIIRDEFTKFSFSNFTNLKNNPTSI
jgi:5'-3' exonuclease